MNELWKNTYKSIVKISHLKDNRVVASGTGFIIEGKLITNNHVSYSQNTEIVHLSTVKENGYEEGVKFEMGYNDFHSKLIDASPQEDWDYSIIDLKDTNLEKEPSLNLSKANFDIKIGSQIALFGYPFSQNNLSIHTGLISSKNLIANVNYLQIDASINTGNSGGPVLDKESGEVIGIVTRKVNGFRDIFNQLKKITGESRKMLESQGIKIVKGQVSLGSNQLILANLMDDLERSANVGIGYAFDLFEVRKHFEI
ncbi:Trypsin-like peptidase domain-containing protein [Maribacter dokdonensis]|uniref:S1 family peptidase n=1 Tax=Maribacter dokdonensis TaxID=320912 RepID=UPI001B0287A1|nr:serine protease [Maribacter dokdonensis]CAG2532846.1 Trypsin-like peptidase domain-containing protein [Maribacter dokdonensis]|tara:strand:+ start:3333 stop:4097 length:765 start_codon:yes stop_codon:yes gene_type:complete